MTTIADQRGAVAETLAHHRIGEFHADVQLLGILETLEKQVRPFVRRRKIVARERIKMRRRPQHRTLRKRPRIG